MLNLENLDEWILQQMPEVEVLEFHCNLFNHDNQFPENRKQEGRWERFTCSYFDISYDETFTILEKAQKKRPEKPTIAFLEVNKNENSYFTSR